MLAMATKQNVGVTIRLVQTAQSSHRLQIMFKMMDKYWSVLFTELLAPTVYSTETLWMWDTFHILYVSKPRNVTSYLEASANCADLCCLLGQFYHFSMFSHTTSKH